MIIPGSRVQWIGITRADELLPGQRIWRLGTVLEVVPSHRTAAGARVNTYALVRRDVDGGTSVLFLSSLREIPCPLQAPGFYECTAIEGEYVSRADRGVGRKKEGVRR